jgi:hypothetical protein
MCDFTATFLQCPTYLLYRKVQEPSYYKLDSHTEILQPNAIGISNFCQTLPYQTTHFTNECGLN